MKTFALNLIPKSAVGARRSLALGAVLVAAGAASSAQACNLRRGGFPAALVKCAVPDATPTVHPLDRLNGALGNPVDRAIARGADTLVPGSRLVLEGAWQAQRLGRTNDGRGRVPVTLSPAAPMGTALPLPPLP